MKRVWRAWFAVATVGVSFAACAGNVPPTLVGSYTGSLTESVFSAQGTQKVKAAMTLEIASNSETTVTLDGVLQKATGSGSSSYGGSIGLLSWGGPVTNTDGGVTFAIGSFKNGRFKGTCTGVHNISNSIEVDRTTEGKISLQKLGF